MEATSITLENNTIYNMDCLEGMKLMDDASVDMILCDLPYGTTDNRWDSVISLESLWVQYRRIIKPNTPIVLTAQCPFDKALGMSNPEWLRYEWIWTKERKTGFMNAKKMPLKEHENILVFYGALPTYNPQMTKGVPYKVKRSGRSVNYGKGKERDSSEYDGQRYPTSVIFFPSQRKNIHPTQKPVALFEYLIRTYSNPGELVLDNCIGSGTTAIACMNTGRNYIGFETDTGYYEAALKRIATHTEQMLGQTA